MDLKSSSVKGVANEVEGKVGTILNGGEGTKQANTMSKEGYKRLLKVAWCLFWSLFGGC